jgi:hypothetical protein
VQRESHEALLGAVVEVALDALPFRVGGSDDARPRGDDLVESELYLLGEPLIKERQPCGRGNALDKPFVVGERCVVHDDGIGSWSWSMNAAVRWPPGSGSARACPWAT